MSEACGLPSLEKTTKEEADNRWKVKWSPHSHPRSRPLSEHIGQSLVVSWTVFNP